MPQAIIGKNTKKTGAKRGRPPKPKEIPVTTTVEEDNSLQIDGNKPMCLCCGTQKKISFYRSYNRFNKVYGVVPYCKECLRGEIWKYYMTKHSKNEQLALHSLLRSINIPYLHNVYLGALSHLNNPNSVLNATSNGGEESAGNLISAYLKNYNSFHDQNGYGDSYIESEGLGEIQGLTSFEETIKVKRKRKVENPKDIDKDKYDVLEYDVDELILRWGDLSDDELASLQNEFLDWKDKLGDFIEEKSTELLVMQICYETLALQKKRELGEKTKDEIKNLLDLMNNSGLIEKQQANARNKKSLGQTIRDLEEYAPIKPVETALDDIDGYREMILAISGCIFKAQNIENEYTEAFDRIFKDYELDAVKNLVNHNLETLE